MPTSFGTLNVEGSMPTDPAALEVWYLVLVDYLVLSGALINVNTEYSTRMPTYIMIVVVLISQRQ